MNVAGALLGAGAGLFVLERALRGRATRAAVWASLVLVLAGTSLGLSVWPATDLRAAAAFLLSSAAVACLLRAGGGGRSVAAGALLLAAALGAALGGDLVRLGPPRVGEALFSSRHGLLFWNPVAWAGLAGLARGWRRDPRAARWIAAGLAVAVIVPAALPAGESGPWAARRWAAALALLAPGLAEAFDAVARTAALRPGRLLAGVGALLVAWNLLFMEQYRGGAVPRDGTVSFAAVAETSAAIGARVVGSPPAWPANWLFAWREGLTPDRYDLLAGKRLPKGTAGAREIDVGDLGTDAALLLEGWSVRHPCEGAICRDVEEHARLLAPLEEAGPFALSVRASGEGWLSAAVNGRDLGARPLAAALGELRFPAGPAGARLNEIRLSLRPGARARVDRLRLERAGGAS